MSNIKFPHLLGYIYIKGVSYKSNKSYRLVCKAVGENGVEISISEKREDDLGNEKWDLISNNSTRYNNILKAFIYRNSLLFMGIPDIPYGDNKIIDILPKIDLTSLITISSEED
jgi:hypothetical protein